MRPLSGRVLCMCMFLSVLGLGNAILYAEYGTRATGFVPLRLSTGYVLC